LKYNLIREEISVDWNKLKAEYIAGGTSYRKLAKKYSVSFSTLRGIAEREKWTDLRAQAQHNADTKLVESIGEQNGTYTVSINDVADKLLDKIAEMINQEGLTTQNLKHLTSAIKDIKDVKGIKSDIDLKEQNARIDKLRKEIEADEVDESKPCGVVMMPPIMADLTPPKEDSDG
jgi:anti-sigma28 factor (negative regulator of flagellin synthesis)